MQKTAENYPISITGVILGWGRAAWGKIGFGLGLIVLALVWSGCGNIPPIQQPQGVCANTPAVPYAGPVADMSGQSNVEFLLDGLYIRERIKAIIEKPGNDQAGAFVTGTNLVQKPASNGSKSMATVEITLQPWLKGASGQPAPLSRYYRLTLALVPHVINPSTVPDLGQRKRLLCPAGVNCPNEEGMLLTFEYLGIYNISFSRDACQTPDLIDGQVVPVVLATLGQQAPLQLPVDQIAGFLSSMVNVPVHLLDATVGADGFLKLGLKYDLAVSHTFVPSDPLSHYTGDWAIQFDEAIITQVIKSATASKVAKLVSGAALTSFTATSSSSPFENKLDISATATVPVPGICGTSAAISISGEIPLQVCRNNIQSSCPGREGQSSLVGVFDTLANGYNSNNVCVSLFKVFSGLNVGVASRLPTDPWDSIAPLAFCTPDGETLYATNIETWGGWSIVGRSTVMDAAYARDGHPRQDILKNCPGVH